MWPVGDTFLTALGQSHAVTNRVEAWFADTLAGAVDIAAGAVTITSRNRVRRTIDLTVPDHLYPDGDDALLNPYGTQLQAYRGIDTLGEAPVFLGRVQAGEDQDRDDGHAEILGQDLFATVNDTRFETPRAAPPGMSNLAAIQWLIGEAIPGASFIVTVADTAYIPSGLMWDRDRGQAIDDLAAAAGAEVFCNPAGSWVIRPVPTLDDSAVWTLADGEGGTVVSDARTVTRDGVYNVIVVIVEQATGEQPIRVVVEDTNPASPTWVRGPFGRVPRFYRSALVTSEEQARTAGAALLARSTGLARARTIQCVPNPAIEAGDRIDVTVAGATERHIADVITLPLTGSGGVMTVTTRSARPDPGDST